ncbi:hypothetical protein PVL29_015671 [Vitis rotundifolia]|uniref:Uncharacterized protein n=1 Tax=Vitis rotundifolia TaxID=103349 RepID=A0AA38ZE41_VITRO|nr:hypothetical protein PVL29_015671 [Vitis rotundifolia]
MPPIICEEQEEEEEEDMNSNLRVEFREKQRNCLFESIAVNPTPSKKAYSEPILVPPPAQIPSTTAADITLEPDEKLPSADDIAYHEMRRSFVVLNNISEESF